jgi:high-affinity Fe2+/Pb2+ permease
MGGFIALAALVAAMVIYRVVWALRREKARNRRS